MPSEEQCAYDSWTLQHLLLFVFKQILLSVSKLYNTKMRTNVYDYLWDVSVSHLSLYQVHSLDGSLGEVLTFSLIHRHRGHGYI